MPVITLDGRASGRSVLLTACLAVVLAALGSALAAAQPPTLLVTHRARAIQPGEAVIVRIASPVPLASVRVLAFDRTAEAVRVVAAGEAGEVWQAVTGIDVVTEPGPATLRVEAVTAAQQAVAAEQPLEVEARAFRTRRLRVAPRYVSPPADVRARIAREATRLQAIYRTSTDEFLCTPPFTRPVSHRQNSPFGARSIFNGKVRGRHLGVDFASPAGAPIHAPAPGRVVLADDLYYTGQTVVIDHGQGVHSILAHLSRITASEHARVKAGDVVGVVGSTGRASGPHLHWSVRVSEARVDPMSLVEVE